MINILTRFGRLPARNSVNPVIYTTLFSPLELASRYNQLVSRYNELAARYLQLVSRYYELASRYNELVSRYNELAPRYYDPVGTRRRFNVEAWLKFRRNVVSTLIQR